MAFSESDCDHIIGPAGLGYAKMLEFKDILDNAQSLFDASSDPGSGAYDFTFDADLAVSGAFSVEGAADLDGALDVAGATTVAALTASGAGIAGTTLAATGNFAVATNKFTVAAASGNTVVAGTLAVTGATTQTGALTVAGALTANGNCVIGNAGSDTIGFYGATPTAQLTGVAVTAAGIHAALVTLGLITA